ncbi:MAG: hypothetical protein Ta2B_10390 [Termitinemataceae bacterium]|nr:MAG: hypothetical protein Ta2B_10390 [Termitinemataceae bacterium]
MVNKNRACLRFYGTEELALYKAHMHKDKAGLDEDNILKLLPKDTTVVHDHNKVNYNDDYSFQNAECNEHLMRDLQKVVEKFNDIMSKAFSENKKSESKYYGKEERTLIMRILDYKNEYLAWVIDFDIPFTNNLSERSLRDAKSKMKISGQFQNEKTASYYANIKSYIETCNRNGVNGFYALHRLCTGNPLALSEIQNSKLGL